MGLLYLSITAYPRSPFYSHVLSNVRFSNLRLFEHRFDERNKAKYSLGDHLPEGSVSLTKNNEKYQGLPVPPNLASASPRFGSGRPARWIMAYNDRDSPELFILFPSAQDFIAGDSVTMDRDLRPYCSSSVSPHSLQIDKLYVWPWIIFMKSDNKIRDGFVFDVPPVFLSRDDALVIHEGGLSEVEAGSVLKVKTGTSAGENKYFNLFYEEKTPISLYFRCPFTLAKDSRFPPQFIDRPGCTWVNKSRFDFDKKHLSAAAPRRLVREWLKDI